METEANIDKNTRHNLGAAMQLRMRDFKFHASSRSVHTRRSAVVCLLDWDMNIALMTCKLKSHLY